MDPYEKLIQFMPTNNLARSMSESMPTEASAEVFVVAFEDELGERVDSLSIELMKRYINPEQAAALCDFYSSPLGQVTIEAFPKIARDVGAVLDGWIEDITEALTRPENLIKAAERLYEKRNAAMSTRALLVEHMNVHHGASMDLSGEMPELSDDHLRELLRYACYMEVGSENDTDIAHTREWSWFDPSLDEGAS